MHQCYICNKPVLVSIGGEVSWGVDFENKQEGEWYHLECYLNLAFMLLVQGVDFENKQEGEWYHLECYLNSVKENNKEVIRQFIKLTKT